MSALQDISLDLPDFPPGEVWLARSGPGDPGLRTRHAVPALPRADIIVHDALVCDEVIAVARNDVEREFAGKRGGRPSQKQGDITNRPIELVDLHASLAPFALTLRGPD